MSPSLCLSVNVFCFPQNKDVNAEDHAERKVERFDRRSNDTAESVLWVINKIEPRLADWNDH